MNFLKIKGSISIRAGIYGCFALLCHVTAILLFFVTNKPHIPHALLERRCAQMLEYSAMSAVILLIGCFLLHYVSAIESKK